MWGFVSKNDTHPTVNILGQEPWYELNLTLTSDPIDIECITAPVMSTCNSTWNATQIMVEAQNQTKVTVDVPWQNSASYVFGNGSTSLSRTCTNSSSVITLEIFDGPANSWQNTTAVKTVTVSTTRLVSSRLVSFSRDPSYRVIEPMENRIRLITSVQPHRIPARRTRRSPRHLFPEHDALLGLGPVARQHLAQLPVSGTTWLKCEYAVPARRRSQLRRIVNTVWTLLVE
jgi:hypothetical protein